MYNIGAMKQCAVISKKIVLKEQQCRQQEFKDENKIVLICGNEKGTRSGFTCFFSSFCIFTDRQYHLTPLLGVVG